MKNTYMKNYMTNYRKTDKYKLWYTEKKKSNYMRNYMREYMRNKRKCYSSTPIYIEKKKIIINFD